MKRILTAIISACIIIALTIGMASAATAGGADDPLISLTYINSFITNLMSRAASMIDSSFGALKTVTKSQLDQLEAEVSSSSGNTGYTTLSLNSGGTVTVKMGSSVILNSGTLRLTSINGTIINVSEGREVGKYDIIMPNNRYFAAENTTAVFTVYSSTAKLIVNGTYSSTMSGTLPPESFIDVPGHWAEQYISSLADTSIVSGVGGGYFQPDATMTRAMFVTIIGRVAKVDKNTYTNSKFSDVSINEWYGPYVAWAAEKRITTGFEDGSFAPNNTISREQMAVIIMRYASVSGITLPQKTEAKIFIDDSLISSWAKDSVYAAQKAGLISGRSDGSFDPKGTATRAEVCTIIYRLINGN